MVWLAGQTAFVAACNVPQCIASQCFFKSKIFLCTNHQQGKYHGLGDYAGAILVVAKNTNRILHLSRCREKKVVRESCKGRQIGN